MADDPTPRFKPSRDRMALALERTAYPWQPGPLELDTFYVADVAIIREELLRLRPDITAVPVWRDCCDEVCDLCE